MLRSTSLDGGFSFGFTEELVAGSPLNDPARLPVRRCLSDVRFLGDYHHVAGDTLHSFHTAVLQPSEYSTSGFLARGLVSRGTWDWE